MALEEARSGCAERDQDLTERLKTDPGGHEQSPRVGESSRIGGAVLEGVFEVLVHFR